DGSKILYSYEPLSGRLQSTTDEKGQVKTQAYNLDDTLAALTYTNVQHATPNVAFFYDTDFNRLTRMEDGTGATVYSYHPYGAAPTVGAGRLASVDGPLADDTVTYSYDELGRVTSRAINGVAQTMAYDAAGRVTTVTNALGSFAYAYDGATRRTTSMDYPNGQKTEYSYYPNAGDHRLQKISNLKPDASPLSTFEYGYDATGRILSWSQQSESNSPKVLTLGYDNADQLTSAVAVQDAATVKSHGCTYDPSGNRTKESVDGVAATFTYNPLNELVGTTKTLPATTYEWDAEQRLTAIVRGNNRSEFSYDGSGRRVRIVEKQNAAATSDKRLVWCGLAVCEERDATGVNVQKRFFDQGFNVPGGVGAGNYFYAKDHLGSIRDINDGSGATRCTYDYEPYGARALLSGDVAADFGFTGHYFHGPSGLHLAPFRAYDSGVGRWINRDPIGETGGVNVFLYCDNNPMMFVDPIGLITYTPNAGQPVDQVTGDSLVCFERCVGTDVTVTGATEQGHSPGSAHGTGQACDIRKTGIGRGNAQRCFTQCYDQTTSYGQEEGNHYHFQTRPGRGGATGFAPGVH
ncbi:MAG: RHS repeat-associated core domain-containing protein, partial [Roseimicrobium sp.]